MTQNMIIRTQLEKRTAAAGRTLNLSIGLFDASCLSSVYNDSMGLDSVLESVRNSLSSVRSYRLSQSEYAPFYDELMNDGINDLEEAVEAFCHEISQMVDNGLAIVIRKCDIFKMMLEEQVQGHIDDLTKAVSEFIEGYGNAYRTAA